MQSERQDVYTVMLIVGVVAVISVFFYPAYAGVAELLCLVGATVFLSVRRKQRKSRVQSVNSQTKSEKSA